MKYLDEEIKLNFNNLPVTLMEQSHTYTLYQNNIPVFYGSVFKLTNQTSISVNVTDLLQSMHYKNEAISLPLADIDTSIARGNVDDIYAVINISGTNYISQHESVAFIYRYPHYITDLNRTNIYSPGYQYVALTNMLQGNNPSNIQKVLVPRIPWSGSDQYGFGTVYQQFNYTNPTISLSGDLVYSHTLNCSAGSNIWYGKCSTLNNNAQLIKEANMFDTLDPCLVPGQLKTGQAAWDSDISGHFSNANNELVNISLCNTSLTKLISSDDLRHLSPGWHEISYTFKGNINFYAFTIGPSSNRVIIPVVLGKENIFQDQAMRTFTVSLRIKAPAYPEIDYGFDDLKILYNITDTAGISLGINKICDIDLKCFSDYYLQWIDRFGSFQSQPFKQSSKYTEKIQSLEIQNYNGERRKTYWNTQGTFQINSGWLDDKTYPIYESIYTSPYLLLYDVKNNKSYNVICTDTSYEEKKFLNGRQIVTMQLNLEINKAQSKIY